MIKEVNVKDLMVGMYVTKLGISWFNHPFARNRFQITRESEIEQIKKCGIVNLTIDTNKGIDVSAPAGKDDKQEEIFSVEEQDHMPPTEEEPVPLKEEIAQSAEIYKKTLPVVHEIIANIKKGDKIDARSVTEPVDQLVASVFRNCYAAVSLAKLKTYDEYTFTHSINVSIFAIALGRQLNYSRKHLKILGAGAMLHDIGKASIPESILNKPGPLTEKEFEVIKRHPELGITHLKSEENVPKEIIQCILDHHERINGTGYRRGLKGAALGDYAKIVSIADCYDAITSTRVYQKATLPHNALKIIFSLMGEHFYPSFVERFIQVVGIYPVGTLVKLNTNEIGIVTAINPSNLLCPDIELITNEKEEKLEVAQPVRLCKEYKKATELHRKITGIISQKKIKALVP